MKLAQLRWLPAIFLATATASVSAMAEDTEQGDDIYGSVAISYAMPTGDLKRFLSLNQDYPLKNGLGMMAAVGKDISGGVRAEVELGIRVFELGKHPIPDGGRRVRGEIKTRSLMVNGFLPFDILGVENFVGLGIGFARHDLTLGFGPGASGEGIYAYEDTVFAYQLIAGSDFPVSSTSTLWVGARYFATDGATFSTPFLEVDYGYFGIETGLRF